MRKYKYECKCVNVNVIRVASVSHDKTARRCYLFEAECAENLSYLARCMGILIRVYLRRVDKRFSSCRRSPEWCFACPPHPKRLKTNVSRASVFGTKYGHARFRGTLGPKLRDDRWTDDWHDRSLGANLVVIARDDFLRYVDGSSDATYYTDWPVSSPRRYVGIPPVYKFPKRRNRDGDIVIASYVILFFATLRKLNLEYIGFLKIEKSDNIRLIPKILKRASYGWLLRRTVQF